MDGQVRVLLVDDHPIARLGLQSVLDGHPGLTLACALPDEAAAIRYLAESEPEVDAAAGDDGQAVAVLDLYLGTDEPCLALVEKAGTRMPVLVVSASARPADVLGALAAGARGYLCKSADPALLASSIRTVAHGGFAMSAELADILQSAAAHPAPGTRPAAGDARTPGPAVGVALSAREEQALGLIARGFTHAQTASRMGVSISTVDTYIDRIRGKLGVGNKAELTAAALARDAARSTGS